MKKYIKFFILSLILMFSFKPDIYAASIHAQHFELDGYEVYKSGTGGNLWKIWINDIGDDDYWAYCVDFGAVIEAGTTSSTKSLEEYFSQGLTSSAAKALAKKVNEYLYFGYHGQAGPQSEKYYMATQQLIWQAIYDSGFYGSDYYKGRGISTSGISNLNYKYSSGTSISVSSEVTTIKNNIATYYTTPSFCSSDTVLEIAVGETATYTDSNNVLSKYKVTCGEGLTCEKSGNELKVTAVDVGADKTITLSKDGAGSGGYVYSISSSYQSAVPTIGKVEPVSCNFGIDTYQNVQTSDTRILLVVFIGLACCITAYVIYYAKDTLNYSK